MSSDDVPLAVEREAAELYGLPLADFTPRRAALAREAKQAGEAARSRLIATLRKPTLAAWLVNMLARHRGDRIAEVIALGEALRDAQHALDAARLRDLGRRRSTLVREVAREAAELAEQLGAAASVAVIEEVAQTLRAAMVDADAAARVQAGMLVRPLTAAGWGAVEGGDVIAFPTPQQRAARRGEGAPGRDAKRSDDRAAAQRELEQAEATLAETRGEMEQLRARADAVAERRATLRDEVAELARQLREAEAELADADEEVRRIRRDRDLAKRTLGAAERAVERARARFDALGPVQQ